MRLLGCALAVVIAWFASAPAEAEGLRDIYTQGHTLFDAGRWAEAQPYLEAVVKRSEREFDLADSELETALANLGRIYFYQRDYQASRAMLKRAAGIEEYKTGPVHPEYMVTVAWLADAYRAGREPGTAEQMLLSGLARGETDLGKNHPSLGWPLSGFGLLYSETQRCDQAAVSLRRAVALAESAGPGFKADLGRRHAAIALHVAICFRDAPEAPARMEQEIATAQAELGRDSISLFYPVLLLGHAYRYQKRYGDAESAYDRAVTIATKTLGQRSKLADLARGNLASLRAYQSQLPASRRPQ